MSAIRGVDFVIPFEIEGDMTVSEAIRRLRPHVFTKGGDRINAETIPEWNICTELGVRVETGIGDEKKWSSSVFLKNWEERSKTSE